MGQSVTFPVHVTERRSPLHFALVRQVMIKLICRLPETHDVTYSLAPVHGEFLIMRLLVSETIPDNVIATQNALGLQVAVGLFQPLPLGVVDSGSDESESHYNTL